MSIDRRLVPMIPVLVLLLAGLAPAGEDADAAYEALIAAWKAREHLRALELAEAFVEAHPDHERIAMARYAGGNSGAHAKRFARAVPFYRAILQQHAPFERVGEVRDELVHCLAGLRELEACIAKCRENLEADPGSPRAHHWRFLIPQSQFRLWRFDEARRGLEAFLERHPDSAFAGAARSYLGRVDPPWDIDERGRVPYAGKYEEDRRFRKAWDDLPRLVEEGHAQLKERLGVDLRGKADLIFVFQDAGSDARKGRIAEQLVVGRDGRPHTVIRFFAEHVVVDPETYRRTIVHEMKHAGFTTLMGQAYPSLPNWVREGLALWGAGEVEDRTQAVLLNQVFSLKGARDVLDGIEDPDRDLQDYLEDGLAFDWLESRRRGNVRRLCRRLAAGKPFRKSFAEIARLPYERAIAAADDHCRKRVEEALGPGHDVFVALRDEFYAAWRQGNPSLTRWTADGGADRLRRWLDENEGHFLEPFARLCLGRALAVAGESEEGRRWLRMILQHDRRRCSLADDAVFWIGYSYVLASDREGATEAFGVLLRDYSWSKSAAKVRGEYPAAGPETGD